ncbi:4'-phosphopantetheinyl transferase family protein [Roseovarius sp. S4756]|uniref:4'-phosphopantetheinyl transferase family protein n=1 Tax=Roseovarius maritimus TaxID=3342637 RepID=UPI00372C60AA
MSAGLNLAGAAAAPMVAGPAQALRALFSPEVAVALSDPRAPQPAPWPAEAPAIARAAPARAREFAAGRAAARDAMIQLGRAPAAVASGADRAPIWPEGLTGSISHTTDRCIAALAPCDRVRAIGTDIEDASPLAPDLIPEICTLAERAWLACQPEAARGILAKLIFSAKECAYKCQYPLTGLLLDFDTFEITPDLDTGQFEATLSRPVGTLAAGTCLAGRFLIAQDLIACGITLGRSPRWGIGQ